MNTPHVKDAKSDTRLLITVAGLVVAGAAAIALVAGLQAEREVDPLPRAAAAAASQSSPDRAARATREPVAELASFAKNPAVIPEVEPTAAATTENPLARAMELYRERSYDPSAAYLMAEIEARPQRAWTHYMLGLALWKAGHIDQAVGAMEESARLDPSSIRTFVNLSRILNDGGQHAAALEAARSALALDPQSPTALFLEGRSQRNLGDEAQAISSLERSIELGPDNGYAHNLLGLILLEQDRAGEALVALERAAELVPDVAYVQNNLGMALERNGSFAEAAAAYRRAADLQHEKAAAHLARLTPLLPQPIDGEPAVEVAVAAAPASDPGAR